MRMIDADALEQIITEKFQEHYGNTVYQFIHDFFRFVIRQIRKATTIEAEPVKRGRWVLGEVEPGYFTPGGNRPWVCSECGYLASWMLDSPTYNYCPNCGAKMDGGAE